MVVVGKRGLALLVWLEMDCVVVLAGVRGWHGNELEQFCWRGRRVLQWRILLGRLDIQNYRRVASLDKTLRVLMLQRNLRRAFQRPILILFGSEEAIFNGGTHPSTSYLLIYHEREQLHKRHFLLELTIRWLQAVFLLQFRFRFFTGISISVG